MPDLKKYINLLSQGETVAFPTETVYGLGADARNPSAIQKVFDLKGRPSDNPLIIHLSDVNQISEFASQTGPDIEKLTAAFWPGPLTLVLKKKNEVLDIITAGLDTVALRQPDHLLAQQLIQSAGPLVAPSANKSGKPSPTRAEHVRKDFGEDFPVIDGGATRVGLESTVLDMSGTEPVILRPGMIGKNEIEKLLGKPVRYFENPGDKIPRSPGQKYSHYQPEAAVYYGPVEWYSPNTLYLLQEKPPSTDLQNVISYSGDLEHMSHELYDRFRQADHQGYQQIHISEIENYREMHPAFYQALMNRIRKAADNF